MPGIRAPSRLLLVAASLALFALAGCSTGPVAGVVPPQDDQGRYVIAMDEHQFIPVEVKVPRGATIVWKNNSTVNHDINGYDGDPPKDERAAWFANYIVKPGQEYARTFDQKGTWTVWCHTHHEEGMKGIVHVE